MTINLWPADAVSGAPEYSGQMLRQLVGGVIGGKTAARPLGGRTGVWPGTPTSTVSVSGSTVTVSPHGGVLDVETPADAGPYCYSVDPAWTEALTPAAATDQRVDSVFVSMQDPAEGDGSSAPDANLSYVAGLAGPAGGARGAAGGPPAIPDQSFELAQITVPKSGTGNPSVTFVAPYSIAAGGIVPVSGSAQYPASPYVGQYIDDPAVGLLRWNGTVWHAFGLGDTGWMNIGLASGYTATGGLTPQFRVINNVVYFRGQVAPSSGTFSTSTVAISNALPSNWWPAGSGYAMASAATSSSAITARLYVPASSGVLTVGFSAAGASYVDLSALSYPLG